MVIIWSSLSTSYLAAAKLLQSCPTLCDPIDGRPPGSTVLGIHQARTLEWVAISFSTAWKWKVKVKSESEKWKWSRSVVSDSQWPHGLQPTRLLHPWDFPGKSTGVGCHPLLHIFTYSISFYLYDNYKTTKRTLLLLFYSLLYWYQKSNFSKLQFVRGIF